jgi:hydroxypyruvate isomerase
MSTEISRRSALAGVATAGLAAAGLTPSTTVMAATAPLKGKLKQSVCKWCYPNLTLDQLCEAAKAIGLQSVELLSENEWETVKKYGLTCAMANGPGPIPDGWNTVANHDKLVKESERLLPLVKAAGLPNMIVFSGNRRGMADSEGLANCARGLKRIMPLAEQLGVTVCMELLNSKRSHKDYMCDHTAWGVELCKQTGSPRFKLLYDIFHMQIMEGDVVDTIRENIPFIGHFHTGGVPGRAEIDDTQELNYRRIAQAVVDTGFTGYYAHEFIPRNKDVVASLTKAAQLCDVG